MYSTRYNYTCTWYQYHTSTLVALHSPAACGLLVETRSSRVLRNVTDTKCMQRSWRLSAVALLLSSRPSSTACSDGDVACEETGCSQWCSVWTCAKDGCEGCGPEIGCETKSPPPPSLPPSPGLPPWSEGLSGGDLNIYGRNGFLYINGDRLHIKVRHIKDELLGNGDCLPCDPRFSRNIKLLTRLRTLAAHVPSAGRQLVWL